jgi:LemA protein
MESVREILLAGTALAGLFILFGTPLWVTYSQLNSRWHATDQALASIQFVMNKKSNIVERLTAIAEQYVKHEKEILLQISADRANIRALALFSTLAGNYPNLKADETFRDSMRDLNKIEDEVQEKYEIHNSFRTNYNLARTTFPNLLMADFLGFPNIPSLELL